jgi:hypothetical protein
VQSSDDGGGGGGVPLDHVKGGHIRNDRRRDEGAVLGDRSNRDRR